MGIQSLHKFLQPAAKKFSLVEKKEEWRGKRIGVDAMCWMHRGAFACAHELILGFETDKFVKFFMDMVYLIQWHGMNPIIVFDGCSLPAKLAENEERRKRRNDAQDIVKELWREKGHAAKMDPSFQKHASQGIKVDQSMIERVIAALISVKVQFVVAPFEADAQLSYMCRKGQVHAVISEDSDLFVYGCPRVIAKMDKYGEGDLFEIDELVGEKNKLPLSSACQKSLDRFFGKTKDEMEEASASGSGGPPAAAPSDPSSVDGGGVLNKNPDSMQSGFGFANIMAVSDDVEMLCEDPEALLDVGGGTGAAGVSATSSAASSSGGDLALVGEPGGAVEVEDVETAGTNGGKKSMKKAMKALPKKKPVVKVAPSEALERERQALEEGKLVENLLIVSTAQKRLANFSVGAINSTPYLAHDWDETKDQELMASCLGVGVEEVRTGEAGVDKEDTGEDGEEDVMLKQQKDELDEFFGDDVEVPMIPGDMDDDDLLLDEGTGLAAPAVNAKMDKPPPRVELEVEPPFAGSQHHKPSSSRGAPAGEHQVLAMNKDPSLMMTSSKVINLDDDSQNSNAEVVQSIGNLGCLADLLQKDKNDRARRREVRLKLQYATSEQLVELSSSSDEEDVKMGSSAPRSGAKVEVKQEPGDVAAAAGGGAAAASSSSSSARAPAGVLGGHNGAAGGSSSSSSSAAAGFGFADGSWMGQQEVPELVSQKVVGLGGPGTTAQSSSSSSANPQDGGGGIVDLAEDDDEVQDSIPANLPGVKERDPLLYKERKERATNNVFSLFDAVNEAEEQKKQAQASRKKAGAGAKMKVGAAGVVVTGEAGAGKKVLDGAGGAGADMGVEQQPAPPEQPMKRKRNGSKKKNEPAAAAGDGAIAIVEDEIESNSDDNDADLGAELRPKKRAKKEVVPKPPMKKRVAKPKKLSKVPNIKFELGMLKDWSMEMFRHMCVLAGCDYTVSHRVKGLALISAVKIVHVFKERALDVIVQRFELPSEMNKVAFIQNFHMALCVFKHHLIFDMTEGCAKHFSNALAGHSFLRIREIDPKMLEIPLGCTREIACVGTYADKLKLFNREYSTGKFRPHTFEKRPEGSAILSRAEKAAIGAYKQRKAEQLLGSGRICWRHENFHKGLPASSVASPARGGASAARSGGQFGGGAGVSQFATHKDASVTAKFFGGSGMAISVPTTTTAGTALGGAATTTTSSSTTGRRGSTGVVKPQTDDIEFDMSQIPDGGMPSTPPEGWSTGEGGTKQRHSENTAFKKEMLALREEDAEEEQQVVPRFRARAQQHFLQQGTSRATDSVASSGITTRTTCSTLGSAAAASSSSSAGGGPNPNPQQLVPTPASGEGDANVVQEHLRPQQHDVQQQMQTSSGGTAAAFSSSAAARPGAPPHQMQRPGGMTRRGGGMTRRGGGGMGMAGRNNMTGGGAATISSNPLLKHAEKVSNPMHRSANEGHPSGPKQQDLLEHMADKAKRYATEGNNPAVNKFHKKFNPAGGQRF